MGQPWKNDPTAFAAVRRMRGDKMVAGVVISCSWPGCKEENFIQTNTHTGARNRQDIENTFRRRNWQVSHNRAHDLCPAHVSAKAAEKRRAKEANRQPLEIVKPTGAAGVTPMNAQPQPPRAEPPAEASRSDKRIIIAKLEEVYLSEGEGYSADWSDQKVASYLGVPRAWVTAVRDELFGPVPDSEESRQVLADAAKLVAEVRTFMDTLAPVVRHVEQLAAQGKDLATRVDVIERRVNEQQKAMGR